MTTADDSVKPPGVSPPTIADYLKAPDETEKDPEAQTEWSGTRLPDDHTRAG